MNMTKKLLAFVFSLTLLVVSSNIARADTVVTGTGTCSSRNMAEGGGVVTGIHQLILDISQKMFFVKGKKFFTTSSLSTRLYQDTGREGVIGLPLADPSGNEDGTAAAKHCIELAKQAYFSGQSFAIFGSVTQGAGLTIKGKSIRTATELLPENTCVLQGTGMPPSPAKPPLWCEVGRI
jgi:hypothetical protein